MRRGDGYSICANVTCEAASCVATRSLKISRIRIGRSQTLTSPPKAFSKSRNCLAKNSSSNVTVSTSNAWIALLIYATLPDSIYVLGFGTLSFWDVEPTTISPTMSANWASSLSDSSMPKEYSMSPLHSMTTRYAFSYKKKPLFYYITWTHYHLSHSPLFFLTLVGAFKVFSSALVPVTPSTTANTSSSFTSTTGFGRDRSSKTRLQLFVGELWRVQKK